MTIRPEHRKTFPTARIAETLLMFMRLRGGTNAAMNSAFVYGPLADFYELTDEVRRLSTTDYYMGDDSYHNGAFMYHIEAAAGSLVERSNGRRTNRARIADLP